MHDVSVGAVTLGVAEIKNSSIYFLMHFLLNGLLHTIW